MIRGKNVTVCIPTIIGREQLLARALDSILAQTLTPHRTIVVCDVERHGAYWTRNQLLRQVRTSWVAWLDDDDEMLPDHLEVLVDGANESGADLVYANPEFVGMSVDPTAVCDDDGNIVRGPINVPFGPAQAQWLRTFGNFIAPAVLVRTAPLKAIGGYPQPGSVPLPATNNSAMLEDALMLIKLLDAGARFHHVLGTRTWRYDISHPLSTGGRGL